MGMVAGAFAAAATTPLDVIKTQMMCTAASRPSMRSSSASLFAQGGLQPFFRCVCQRVCMHVCLNACVCACARAHAWT